MTPERKEKLAEFWNQYIDPLSSEKNKLQPFSKGWNDGAKDLADKVFRFKETQHTWHGVGYRFGAAFGTAGEEQKRLAWRWANDRLHKYGWIEVERYEDLK